MANVSKKQVPVNCFPYEVYGYRSSSAYRRNAPKNPGWLWVGALIAAVLLIGFSGGLEPIQAQAAKKKAAEPDPAAQAAAAADAELQKALEPLDKSLTQLVVKMQSHLFFSPKDSAQLTEAHFTLLDLISKSPTNPLLAKPAYQLGFLFMHREAPSDAFELFQFVSDSFPDSLYAKKAKAQLVVLEKQLGKDALPPAALGTNNATTTVPGSAAPSAEAKPPATDSAPK